MKFQSISLLSNNLDAVYDFYHKKLELNIVNHTEKAIHFQAGATELIFEYTANIQNPTYHFAFNIPKNQVNSAKKWLAERLDIIKDTKNNEVIPFPNWNAEALYFMDSVGNIVEFIARHDLDNDATLPFSVANILSISEIGLPVSDVLAFVKTIQNKLFIPDYKTGSEKFYTLGDEEGLFIVVPTERVWYMTNHLKSATFPVKIALKNEQLINFDYGLYSFSTLL